MKLLEMDFLKYVMNKVGWPEMKYKFNPFERAVGLFLSVAIIGSFLIGVGVAVNKNLFEDKAYYFSYVSSASNIRSGSAVFLDGLKIGKIEQLDLDEEGKIRVKYSVLKKYIHGITLGTKAQFVRPFIFGDKVLNISRNISSKKILKSGSVIPLIEGTDIMDALTGEKVNTLLTRFDDLTIHLNDLVLASRDIMIQAKEKDKVKRILENLAIASNQLKRSPKLAKDVSVILSNLNQITTELNELKPVFSKFAHQLPEGTAKSIQLLNETVTTVKALQKNYFLKGHVETIKKEELNRLPASEKTP